MMLIIHQSKISHNVRVPFGIHLSYKLTCPDINVHPALLIPQLFQPHQTWSQNSSPQFLMSEPLCAVGSK